MPEPKQPSEKKIGEEKPFSRKVAALGAGNMAPYPIPKSKSSLERKIGENDHSHKTGAVEADDGSPTLSPSPNSFERENGRKTKQISSKGQRGCK